LKKKLRFKELPVLRIWKKNSDSKNHQFRVLEKNQNERTTSSGFMKKKSESKNHQFWVLEKNQDQRTASAIL
jgi:hypothetical protein